MSDLNRSLALSEGAPCFFDKQSPSMFSYHTNHQEEYLLESGFTYLRVLLGMFSLAALTFTRAIILPIVGKLAKYREPKPQAAVTLIISACCCPRRFPTCKVKSSARSSLVRSNSLRLNTRRHMVCLITWFDRPLGIGRVLVKGRKQVESRLVNIEDDVVMIPSLAIHLEHKMVSPEFSRAKKI